MSFTRLSLPVEFVISLVVMLLFPSPCLAQWTKTIDCPDGTVYRDVRRDAGREEFCERLLPGSLKVQDGPSRWWYSQGHFGEEGNGVLDDCLDFSEHPDRRAGTGLVTGPFGRQMKRQARTNTVRRTPQAFGFELGFGCGAGFGMGLGFGWGAGPLGLGLLGPGAGVFGFVMAPHEYTHCASRGCKSGKMSQVAPSCGPIPEPAAAALRGN